ncbi:hypothetical protein Cme02nite_67570 [Catellatospora methionotrophica]|uniref:Uncharacterized protein n=1 Tax=Catellatospora methionotrophica TaxID=121620 RepID=A0A8J3LHM8_9ACTN|nr:hypothetical protein [Catellatospora methionotrophica]GIG18425.1 hypothetical protein Cme02nite_67570 [Catellatospora methionotrophica]
MATSKIGWITAGVVSAAAAGVGAVMALRNRRHQATEDSYTALAGLSTHQNGKHKKDRVPRKLKKSRAHAEALASGHGGQHW